MTAVTATAALIAAAIRDRVKAGTPRHEAIAEYLEYWGDMEDGPVTDRNVSDVIALVDQLLATA